MAMAIFKPFALCLAPRLLSPSPSPSPSSCILRSRSSSATSSDWTGLQSWRSTPVDERRIWGRTHADSRPDDDDDRPFLRHLGSAPPASLADWGALVLATSDPAVKVSITHHAFRLWYQGQLPIGLASAPDRPARPSKPELVPPRQVPQGKSSILPPKACILHNLAHVELNAVDLAWDTVVRFSKSSEELGRQFFADFVHVADDESRHFGWCSQRLAELGFRYGDMPAHDMLLNDGEKTSGSVMARLVVVPMVQEARGLDGGPRLAQRLVGMGDVRSAGIVNQIAEEELAHVAVGVSWFTAVCNQMEMIPDRTFKDLLQKCKVELKGPFNHSARAKAGIPRQWYDSSFESSEVDVKEKINKRFPNGSKDKHFPVIQEVLSAEDIVHHLEGSVICSARETEATDSGLPEVCERLSMLVAFEKGNIVR